ncbi:MAG: hypothetical protein AAFV53_15260 [Myxococcota bacterium]
MNALLLFGLFACTAGIDGEVGTSTFSIDNQTRDALAVSFTPGPVMEPEVLRDTIEGGEQADVFLSGGCFGCWDQPEDVLATLSLAPESGDAIVFDPIANGDWVEEKVGEYDAIFTLTLQER